MTVCFLTGDCRDVLRTLPDDSVHCVVTSPPYWGLRDYGVDGQIGLESDFTSYIAIMVEVFRDVRRVMRADGTLWMNLGDSYAGSKVGNTNGGPTSMKSKDLCGIPWRVAFALQADGWWLRQDIIWSKPNPMPESVTDRCTKAHEYLFLLSKSGRYYFDQEATREPLTGHRDNSVEHHLPGNKLEPLLTNHFDGHHWQMNPSGRNKRSVWEVATAPFSAAHFATFPPALIEPCIKAGTSERGCCAKCGTPWMRKTERKFVSNGKSAKRGSERDINDNRSEFGTDHGTWNVKTLGWSPSCKCGANVVPCTVLDPFGGAGTTGLVADRLQRSAVMIELNPAYVEMARRRVLGDAPLFTEAAE